MELKERQGNIGFVELLHLARWKLELAFRDLREELLQGVHSLPEEVVEEQGRDLEQRESECKLLLLDVLGVAFERGREQPSDLVVLLNSVELSQQLLEVKGPLFLGGFGLLHGDGELLLADEELVVTLPELFEQHMRQVYSEQGPKKGYGSGDSVGVD